MKNSLNILLIANSNEIGGGNRSLETLSLGLRQLGHTPIIVFPQEGPAVAMMRKHGLKIIIKQLNPPAIKTLFATIKSMFAWIKIILKNNIDLIHANGTLAARSVVCSAKICRKPLVCHIRFDFGKDYYEWAFKYLPSPNCFIFVSESMKMSIKPSLIKASPAASFEVVHNAVILSNKECPPPSEQVNRIGIIANFQKVKGHEDFFYMAKELLQTQPHLHFDVIGSDVQNQGREKVLKSLAKSLDIENQISFHGHLDDIYTVIDLIDIVICPSHEEPFGRCAIEAMSRGKPVVVTNVGGLPEIVEDNVNGFIVPAKKPESLVVAVKKLINDKGLRQFISSQNITKVLKQFSQKGHVESILNLYQKVTHFKGLKND